MKKIICIVLILLIINVFFISDFFHNSIYAGSLGLQMNIDRDSIISIIKGIGSILLLRLLYNYTDEKGRDVESSWRGDSQLQPPIKQQPVNNIDGKVIVIDPGHGGLDPGAVGPTGLKEKDVVLDISLKLYDILRKETKARVYLTRDKDEFISLNQRVAFANNLNADLFISVHSNAHYDRGKKGIETFAHFNAPRESWAVTWYIHDSLIKELGLDDRGLKADNFQVIRETNMKSILLEIGFISNYGEEALLKDSNFRLRSARAIYDGLLNYYSR